MHHVRATAVSPSSLSVSLELFGQQVTSPSSERSLWSNTGWSRHLTDYISNVACLHNRRFVLLRLAPGCINLKYVSSQGQNLALTALYVPYSCSHGTDTHTFGGGVGAAGAVPGHHLHPSGGTCLLQTPSSELTAHSFSHGTDKHTCASSSSLL